MSAVNFTFVMELVTLGHFSQARYFAFSFARNYSTNLYILSLSYSHCKYVRSAESGTEVTCLWRYIKLRLSDNFFTALYTFTSQPLDTFYELTLKVWLKLWFIKFMIYLSL